MVRVEVERAMPPALRVMLLQALRFDGGEQPLPLGDDDVYEIGESLDPTVLKELASLPLPELRFPLFQPRNAFLSDRSMEDIESHTIIYVRELLATRAIDDPEVATFLACWFYEETFHVHGRVTRVRRRGDVEEDELVRAFGVVAGGQLDGIARVDQVHEVDALDDASRVDVEARDHPHGAHAATASSTVNRRS